MATEQTVETPICETCGNEKEWVRCWNCGGEGEIDRYEDDPLWYVGKMRYWPCENCKGQGHYPVCGNCFPDAVLE